MEFPRIHDLDRLQRVLPAGSQLHDIDVDLVSLTEWAIAGRYPADTRDANRDDAEQAVGTHAPSSTLSPAPSRRQARSAQTDEVEEEAEAQVAEPASEQ